MSRFQSCFACILLSVLAATGQADIFRWDNAQPIPGTEGITAGPGVQLDHRQLQFARLGETNLAGANFSSSDLTNAAFSDATLRDVNLTGAIVTGARFMLTTSKGFTKEQLYSTASYQSKNLQAISLGGNNLSGWDFHNQNLAGAYLSSSTLTGADFSGAIVKGASFNDSTSRGFTRGQLESTASYQAKDLQGIGLGGNDLTGWDFHNQNLAGAILYFSTLTGADFSGAIVKGAHFINDSTSRGITRGQLESTASYQAKDLQGIGLGGNDLTGWDFRGQNLTNASLGWNLTGADLTGADARGVFAADFTGAITDNMVFGNGSVYGLRVGAGERFEVRDYDGGVTIFGYPIPRLPIAVLEAATFDLGGLLQVTFEADDWNSTIQFAPGIPVSLGGSLGLSFADDVNPATQIGRTLRIFDWTGVAPTGAFTVSSPYVWDTTNLYTTGEVTLAAIPEPTSLLLVAIAAAPALLFRIRREQA